MTLWMIRHGLTRPGEEGKYQGSLDEGLSLRGRESLRAAPFLPAALYVSPALRARETASILFPGVEQTVIPDLREMDFGTFEDRSWQEMETDPDYRAWVESGCRTCCPGGEDMAGYSARVNAAVDAILQNGKDNTAIVAHGGTMMAALELRGRPARGYWQWQRPCGCGWMLEYDREADSLRVLREVSFLR